MKLHIGQQTENEFSFTSIPAAIHYAASQHAKQVEIELASGIYRLEAPITITAEMGFESIRIAGEPGTVVCGSRVLSPSWQAYRDGISCAQIEKGLDIDMLYINGKLYHMARYPKYDENVRVCQGYAGDCISPQRVSRWQDPTGGYLHALHCHRWGDFHYQFTGKDEQGNLQMIGGTQNNRRMGIHEEIRYVENIFEELSAPGEWFYNAGTGMLYVYFEQGTDRNTACTEAVIQEELVKVTGTPDNMIHHVEFENITFRHTKRTFMKMDEPLLRSDWCIYRGGALYFENTRDCAIRNCRIVDMGSNAVCVNGRNSGFVISGSLIREISGNGICFIGNTDCVRSPLFEYNERQNIQDLDLEAGPKTDHFPVDCQVVDCLITRTGRVEKQTAAVQVSMSKGIRIANCSIYELPRAAINFSEGNFGGHIIENCDIFDTVMETGDHGSFNSWGRDRFWGLEGIDLNDLEAQNLQQLPYLDAVHTNVIRNNRLRCDWGWDIDLDDGSSNYEIYNNLCLNGGIKLREGFGRKAYNNITVNNTIHVWFRNSHDSITGNILFSKYKPILMDYAWGDEIDGNFIHNSAAATTLTPAVLLQKDSGKDAHSHICNCMFADPKNGDYTVCNQAVLDSGFRNFDMKHFGVISPELKKIAKSPVLPAIRPLLDVEEDKNTFFIHNDTIYKNITSMEEASAYGARSDDGLTADGVILYDMPPYRDLAAIGLKVGDIILAIDNEPIRNTEELKKLTAKLDHPLAGSFKILRDQAEMMI